MTEKLHIHIGPGHHDKLMLSQISTIETELSYSNYWPKFVFNRLKSGVVVSQKKSFIYDILSYLVWGIWHRLPYLNRKPGQLDILFPVYDYLVASKLSGQLKVLIAWPQVSLFCLKKAQKSGTKRILEHPMVHVNTWMELMKNQYAEYGSSAGVQYSLFSKKMVSRMLEEYKYADQINLLSSYSKQTFISNGISESKLRVTLPGIDVNYWEQAEDLRPTGKTILLFVGRLELLKGVHYLLEAYSKMQMPDTELWLVGNRLPEIEPYLTDLNPGIKLLGVKDKESLKEIYHQAHILILPSVQESFGLVMLEALASGMFVVASANTGIGDILAVNKNAGLSFESASRAQLTERMKLACSTIANTPMKEIKKTAINTAREFSLENYKKSLMTLLN